MVLFRATLQVTAASREQVIRSLSRIVGPTRAQPGCVGCQFWGEVGDDGELLLEAEWDQVASIRKYVRSDVFRVILSALDYAEREPEVRFDTLDSIGGMEFIAECRGGGPAGD